ncbi:MAG: 3-oxoacyl-ACP reductase FabG [Blastocatellales bacterium]|nr:3-oxoacyl-ACP reductase FabG [Blastocatellales bacterium]
MGSNGMEGRIALVTGASSGIGRAAAIALAECGADVALNYLKNREGAEATVQQIAAMGRRALAVQADVSTRAGAFQLAARVRSQFGRVDVLVNNAGDLIERRPLRDFTDELWDRVMDLNLRSVFLCSQAVMGEMIDRRSGVIINVGSIAGHNGGGPGAAVYAASKAAVHCLTKGFAKELAPHGVRVNAVAPGVVMTPFHEQHSTPEMLAQFTAGIPLGRLGSPEECGRVIAFLASDAASYIHGEMIEINGGQLMV